MAKLYRNYRKFRLFLALWLTDDQPISVGPRLAWHVAGIVWDEKDRAVAKRGDL